MRIALSGYRGMIGSTLERELAEAGHVVVRLTREMLYDTGGSLLGRELRGCDGVIHLAGAPVLQRWTAQRRRVILESRTVTTHHLASALMALPAAERPSLFLTASAIGIYRNGELHDEESTRYDTHFAAEVTREWEQASAQLEGVLRRVVFRIGLVLDARSRLIALLWWPFLLGVGGPVGSGRQPFPFIHMIDLVRAFLHALENSDMRGIYNLTAPEQVTNRDFARQLGTTLHRPSLIPVPAFFMKFLFGKAAILTTDSPAVTPARLPATGFTYLYPSLRLALEEVVGRKRK